MKSSSPMKSLMDYAGSYEFGYRPPNAEGCVSLMPELSKLKNAIGFHQQVSFKEGILETIKGEQVK